MAMNKINGSIIDRDKLPLHFPTHRHTPEFWEQLGRTIATYGFLEEILGKAIFAFTATREYSENEIEAAYREWLPQLERALTDQLWNLAESYGKAVRDNPASTTSNIDEIVEAIKEATIIRNVLCHGSWRGPDVNGASIPLFINKRRQLFVTAIDSSYLRQIQKQVVHLICSVIDTVTAMGWQFPGGAGNGKIIFEF
jgi:hypothetical protein